jgi:hypothetical protein
MATGKSEIRLIAAGLRRAVIGLHSAGPSPQPRA